MLRTIGVAGLKPVSPVCIKYEKGNINMKLPEEFCERMREITGGEYEDFIKSYDTQLNKGVRINTLKCPDVPDFLKNCERVPWCPDGYLTDTNTVSGKHPYHAAGVIYFQEPSAMCAAAALPLVRNAKILDLCAAPGGKTTQIGARMKNEGLLVSNEISAKRAAILSENVERMGLTNTIVTNETPTRLADRFEGFFDGILVDAPCSGEGMFRKEPQAITEWSVAHTVSCAQRQKNILDDAYKMLKCGGYIMYSTCTFSYDENELVVKYMTEKYGMELVRPDGLDMLSPGVGDGAENCRRVFPHKHKGEGHFAALLRRREPNETAAVFKRKSVCKHNGALEEAVKLYREFEADSLAVQSDGEFILFGDNLYLMPEYVNTDKLRIVRCGLHLGVIKKNRFEPSHALSHALCGDAYINSAEFSADSEEIKRYMRGETVSADICGWCAVKAGDYVIGWGKASNRTIKNHYPKYLRAF